MKRKNTWRNIKGSSPAISIVVITAVTVMLVLVAGNYATQTLEKQQGSTEFDTINRSFEAFDDALRDVAWDRGASRSTRFTTRYGHIEVIPDALPLEINITEYPSDPDLTLLGSMSIIKYEISNDYLTFGDNYQEYLVGDDKAVVNSSSETYGRVLIEQKTDVVTLLLNYRVRALREGPSVLVGSSLVNYVDILIINITAAQQQSYSGDFELVAKNMGISTISAPQKNVVGDSCTVNVIIGETANSVTIPLDPGTVKYNFVIAEVLVIT